jgi:NDP-sugar pyrophosphorylase family protein
MHYNTQTQQPPKTTVLFNLNSERPDGFEPLEKYLRQHEYPWDALGKNLTLFLTSLIESIPKNQRLKGKISPHAVIEDNALVVVEEGATVEAHAYIAGPTYIAAGATVRHAAYVRGSVILCSGAVVGHTSEAKGSILMPHAKAAHFAYVGDSILGRDCNLGAGTKFANLRFDATIVNIRDSDVIYPTGLKKLGAILGDGAQTGCNSVTNPGTILMPQAMLLPNSTGRGIVRKK